ncbi:MAG TPA: methyltransferase domain-containing protein [Anaerolineae bacterium]|nr:methyltransferase domain-containing protein [Anaerolineae bacterium]
MTRYTSEQTRTLISGFHIPDRARYPELTEYTRDEIYEDFFGGGGLYLATHMLRTLRLKPADIVLDLGCGKGPTSIFLAKHFSVKVIAVDLWTSAAFLNDKFTARGYRDRIVPLNLDVTQPLPFAENYFDAIFCLNSFNFYGGSVEFVQRLLTHLNPGGQLCIGSEVLSDEFTAEQLQHPPYVYAFQLPPPNEHVNVFEGDFKKQHTPAWWRSLFEQAGLDVEHCAELDDATAIYEELVRYEYEHDLDPFDVEMCLQQFAWGRTHRPRKTLFVLTASKR